MTTTPTDRPEGWPWTPDKIWGLRSSPTDPWRLTEPELFALWRALYKGEDGDAWALEDIKHRLGGEGSFRRASTAVRLLKKARFMSSYRWDRGSVYTARTPTDDYWSR